MAIKITLENGTTIECETATIAKSVLADAVKEEQGSSEDAVRYEAYRDAVKAKMAAYKLGNFDAYRTAINTLVKARLSMEMNGHGYFSGSVKLLIYCDKTGRALEILDELLPTPKEETDGECTSDTTIEDDIKTWLYSEEVQ